VAVEDTVSTSWEEEESQLEELEYEYSSEEPEDNVNARQPTPRKSKPFQSLFELEDMASPNGGGERGVRRFSGAAGTIEVEDFKREFTMWCELQKSRNPNFNPYMVWRALFGCLEEAPLADYEEFEAANFTAVVAWRDFYAPNYANVFGGNRARARIRRRKRQTSLKLKASHLHSIQLRSSFYDSFGITKASE
jgi:hypothetical protein